MIIAMYNHADKDYLCPICRGIGTTKTGDAMIEKSDIFYEDKLLVGVINSFFAKNNPGAVILVPRQHFENVYELPDSISKQILPVAKRIALAMKKQFGCEGVTISQNNEPASSQHAFHYHMHIIPRYDNDKYYTHAKDRRVPDRTEKAKYADLLKKGLQG